MMKRLIRVDIMDVDGDNVQILIDQCKEPLTGYLRFAAVAGVADAGVADALHTIIKDVTESDEDFEYMVEYMAKIVKVGAVELERRLGKETELNE